MCRSGAKWKGGEIDVLSAPTLSEVAAVESSVRLRALTPSPAPWPR